METIVLDEYHEHILENLFGISPRNCSGEITCDYLIKFIFNREQRLRLPIDKSDSSTLDTFEYFLRKLYPKDYATKISHLIYTKFYLNTLSENLTSVFQTLLQLPLISELTYHKKVFMNRINEYFRPGSSLREICRIVSGHLELLRKNLSTDQLHLTLKRLAEVEGNYRTALLLVGEPGVGKSYVGTLLSNLLDLPCLNIECASADYLELAGSSPHWGNATASRITKALVEMQKFPLIVVLDEVDKTGSANQHRLIDTINHIIDTKDAFIDHFLELPLYHSKSFIYILTANDESRVEKYISSRVIKFEIPTPSVEERCELGFSLFIKNIRKMNIEIGEKLANSSALREVLYEVIRKYNWDLRQILINLDVIYKKFLSPLDNDPNGADVEKFFVTELRKFVPLVEIGSGEGRKYHMH